MMELVDVTKLYQQGRRTVHAVRGVSLRIEAREFVCIMGPSGSGKSTLMHLLGALDTPTTGNALFRGRDLNAMSDRERAFFRRSCIGFVFQFFNLLPTLTAAENVALPLLLARESHSKSVDKARGALERVGLRERAEHFPDEMSGGEMQRVAIARALIAQPDAVLCDEPTGNLDSVNSAEILKLLRSLPDIEGRTVIMVTHDATAAEYGDRLILIRDGLIEADRRQEPLTNGAPPREGIKQAGGVLR
jgi:putative ABC transport system ATP-binding protein